MKNALINQTYKNRQTGSRFKVYNVTDDKKGVPSDGPIVYLVLVKNGRLIGSEQMFISMPLENLSTYFTVEPFIGDVTV